MSTLEPEDIYEYQQRRQIRVIETTTQQRNQETQQLFESIRPLLDQGYSYMAACIQIGHTTKKAASGSYRNGWFRDLKEYGAKEGYPYKDYSGKRRVKQ